MDREQWFQVLLVLAGVIAQLLSSVLDKTELKRILTVIAGVSILVAAVWVASTAFGQKPEPDQSASMIQQTDINVLQMFPSVLQTLDFEDGSLQPWSISPSTTVLDSSINSEAKFVNSGEKSLKATVSLSEDVNYFTLESDSLEEYEAKAMVAYVFVPSSSQSRGKSFYARWTVGDYFSDGSIYLDNGTESFKSPEVYSETYKIRTGEWVPIYVFAGVGYRDRENKDQYMMWKKGVYSAILTIWCSEDYIGDIYVDDLLILGK